MVLLIGVRFSWLSLKLMIIVRIVLMGCSLLVDVR